MRLLPPQVVRNQYWRVFEEAGVERSRVSSPVDFWVHLLLRCSVNQICWGGAWKGGAARSQVSSTPLPSSAAAAELAAKGRFLTQEQHPYCF